MALNKELIHKVTLKQTMSILTLSIYFFHFLYSYSFNFLKNIFPYFILGIQFTPPKPRVRLMLYEPAEADFPGEHRPLSNYTLFVTTKPFNVLVLNQSNRFWFLWPQLVLLKWCLLWDCNFCVFCRCFMFQLKFRVS